MKYILPALVVTGLLANAPSVFAAASDGAGPWADVVVTSSQANTKGGTPVSVVNPARSDPQAAVGVAENDTVDGSFFSLGFGGSITLSFDNPISNGVVVVEATNPGYPTEQAKVELSADGVTWVNAGTVVQDGSVTMPGEVSCAKYVRLTDTSNAADFAEATADAYDVDGVRAEQGHPCELPTPTPTPGGGGGTCEVKQENKLVVSAIVSSTSNTGTNKVTKNTGGGVSASSGDATSRAALSVTGGSNAADLSGCCCGASERPNCHSKRVGKPKRVKVNVIGNGANSQNTVEIH